MTQKQKELKRIGLRKDFFEYSSNNIVNKSENKQIILYQTKELLQSIGKKSTE
jgi:hypothetical protein